MQRKLGPKGPSIKSNKAGEASKNISEPMSYPFWKYMVYLCERLVISFPPIMAMAIVSHLFPFGDLKL